MTVLSVSVKILRLFSRFRIILIATSLSLVFVLSIHSLSFSTPRLPTQSNVQSSGKVWETAQFLTNLGARLPDSPESQQARNYLLKAYQEAGYTTEVQTFSFRAYQPFSSSLTLDTFQFKGQALLGSPLGQVKAPLVWVSHQDFTSVDVQSEFITTTGHNIIAYLPKESLPLVVIGAHYDTVTDSPGANDNASGTAVVLELARHLADEPFTNGVRFVAFDSEELGLGGSKAFMAFDRVYPRAMVNIDTVGLNQQLLMYGTPNLIELAHEIDPSVPIFIPPDNRTSDHEPFKKAGVPVLFFTRGLDLNIHTPNDKEVNQELLEDTVQVTGKIVRKILQPFAE